MNTQVQSLITAFGPTVLSEIVSLVHKAIPVPTTADQAAKDTANAAKASTALATATGIATAIAPAITGAMDPATMTAALVAAIEQEYQTQKPAMTAATAPAAAATVTTLRTPCTITGVTITGNLQTAK